jgi:hypothetical protein
VKEIMRHRHNLAALGTSTKQTVNVIVNRDLYPMNEIRK